MLLLVRIKKILFHPKNRKRLSVESSKLPVYINSYWKELKLWDQCLNIDKALFFCIKSDKQFKIIIYSFLLYLFIRKLIFGLFQSRWTNVSLVYDVSTFSFFSFLKENWKISQWMYGISNSISFRIIQINGFRNPYIHAAFTITRPLMLDLYHCVIYSGSISLLFHNYNYITW